MRLTECDPKWVDIGDRKGMGILFRCLAGHCEGYNVALFANPLDGGPAFEGDSWKLLDELVKVPGLIGYEDKSNLRRLVRGCGKFRWARDPQTTTFEALTLSPSCDLHECGHKTLVQGEWR